MKVSVYDISGKETKKIELNKDIFGCQINKDLLAQAVKIYQNNQRAASGKAKTRADILRTTAKVFKQKGTGNARHGSKKAPIFVGGGKAHGPNAEQHFNLVLPKKMKIAAIKSALSLYASEKRISAVEGLNAIKKPNTKKIAKLIDEIKQIAKVYKISVVLTKELENALKSIRNIKNVNCLSAEKVTTYEILRFKHVIFAEEAITVIENRLK